MAIFEWDDSFRTGLPQVDQQHRVLVEMINTLDEAVSTGGEQAYLSELLKGLYDYTRYHFNTEEELMGAAPALATHYRQHKSEHDLFVEEVERASNAPAADISATLLDFLVKWLVRHILGSDKEMARLLGGGTDNGADAAAAQRKLYDALHESEVRFRTLADSAPILIWLADADLRRTYFNRPWREFTGLQAAELRRDGWSRALHPDDREECLAAHAARRDQQARFTAEYRLRRADGRYRWMLETVVPRYDGDGTFAGQVGSCVDITERKQAEQLLEHAKERLEQEVRQRTAELTEANQRLEREKAEQRALIEKLNQAHTQLLQSEKMASIGQLAAGVAHEINNPVGYIKSNLNTLDEYVRSLLHLVHTYQEAARRLPEADRARLEEENRAVDLTFLQEDLPTLLEESREGVERVREIVRDLKEFSHIDKAQWQRADLHRGLESTLNVARNEIKYKAEIVRDYGELPLVECLPQQLNQVFMNILVNAAQAIPEHGTITLRTRAHGEHVTIDIADTGPGIAAEHLARVFDPFFTTKPIGKGTGLGLSIAYGIVRRHGGELTVQSRPGEGSTFRITLPVVAAREAAADGS